jgi:two-component system, NarL family, response regulator DesR
LIERIRLLVASRQALFRESLVAALDRRRRFQVVAQAEAEAQTLAQARGSKPDVAIIDFEMSPEGRRLVAELRNAGCRPLVLASADPGMARVALEAGAHGYVDKNYQLQDFERAIERIHSGDAVVAPGPAHSFLQTLNKEPSGGNPAGDLTERELDVVRLVARGHTNAETGRQLCITEHTVKGHLAKILGKLMLQNRVQLATYALHAGLAEPAQPNEGLAIHHALVEPP